MPAEVGGGVLDVFEMKLVKTLVCPVVIFLQNACLSVACDCEMSCVAVSVRRFTG